MLSLHQCDGAATKTATGHAAAENTALGSDPLSDFDDGVQFFAAHFVIITQGIMAGIHELADRGPIGGADAFGSLKGAFDFPDDVASAAEDNVIHLPLGFLKHFRSRITQ